MPNYDPNVVAPLVQKVYDLDPVANVFDHKNNSVFRSHCEIESNGAGENVNFEIIGAGTVLASPDYALAGGAFEAFRFSVEPVSIHFRATMERETMDKVKGKSSKAQIQVQKMALDMAIEHAWQKFDRHTVAKRGELGIITAISGSTITIGRVAGTADAWITNRLKPSMVLVAGATPGSGTLRGSDPGDEEIVSSWNDETAVITCASAISGNWQVGDTVWEKGDAYFTQTLKNGRRTIAGIPAWLDETAAAGSENFYGKDRSTSPYNLQPIRMTCTAGFTVRKQLVKVMTKAYGQRQLGMTLGLIPTPMYEKALLEQDAREVNTTLEKQAMGKTIVIALSGIKVGNGAGGMCEVYPFPLLASDFAYFGEHKEAPFKIMYTDKMIRLHEDGQALWRRVQGGVTNATTSEKVPAVEAEGDLRVLLINKCPAKWLVLSGCTTLANPN